MVCKGTDKRWWKALNPFSKLIETRRELKNLSKKRETLEKELKEIEEKRKKILYLKQ